MIQNAGAITRWFAAMIDSLLVGFMLKFIMGSFGAMSAIDEKGALLASFIMLGSLSLYEVAFIASPMKGTVGKNVMGIKVVNANGERPSVGQSILRAIFKSFGPLAFVSAFLVFFKRRAIHDSIAGTYTVRKSGGARLDSNAAENAFK